MISGIDLTATVDYTLESDTDNPTIWKLGILPSDVFGKISSGAVALGDIETAYSILGLSIKGWENFTVPFKTEVRNICGRDFKSVPAEILSQIPLMTITELTKKCLELNGLTTGERKN